MPFVIIPTSVPRSGTKTYSTMQWEAMRPVFTQLYREQGKSLLEVQTILAQEHDFRPTYVLIYLERPEAEAKNQDRYAEEA